MKPSIEKWNKLSMIGFLSLVPILIVILSPTATALTFGIEAHIDGRDQLIFQRNTLKWHHLDLAAVGRQMGAPILPPSYIQKVIGSKPGQNGFQNGRNRPRQKSFMRRLPPSTPIYFQNYQRMGCRGQSIIFFVVALPK